MTATTTTTAATASAYYRDLDAVEVLRGLFMRAERGGTPLSLTYLNDRGNECVCTATVLGVEGAELATIQTRTGMRRLIALADVLDALPWRGEDDGD